MKRMLTTVIALMISGTTAMADDLAVVISSDRYPELDDNRGSAALTQVMRSFNPLGFDLLGWRNPVGERQSDVMNGFADRADDAERVIVALAGRFVTDGADTWLLPSDAEEPRLFALPEGSILVSSVLAVLSEDPGSAILMLAPDGSEGRVAPRLRYGLGRITPPSGVTVLTGEAEDLADLVEEVLAVRGADLAAALEERDEIQSKGLLFDGYAFVPASARPFSSDSSSDADDDEAQERAEADERAWRIAARSDTIDSYRIYLAAFPAGEHAREARDAIAAIQDEPNRTARLAEEALDLSRDTRIAIQRNLTDLGYNTRGIDGIFGPGTRTAITNWQRRNGFDQTSYLVPRQIERIGLQAESVREERAAEEERQRAELAARDEAFWRETRDGGIAGLRSYLERYPRGEHAAEAQARLDELVGDQQEQRERQAWDAAKDADTAAAYRAYLDAFPNGRNADKARDRLGDRSEAQYERAEDQLGFNRAILQLVELALASQGYNPGAVDGRLDNNARRAIAGYQQARGISRTGYLNNQTIEQLLGDGLNLR